MFMSPLSLPQLAKFYPCTCLTFPLTGRKKTVLFGGMGDQSCLTLIHLANVC